MKPRLSIATHVSIALALITSSVLLIAHTLGLVPDPRAEQLRAREAVAELVACRAVWASESGDFAGLQAFTNDFLSRTPDVLSIGLRLNSGELSVASDRHEQLWAEAQRFVSSPSYARVPVLRDGRRFAEVEVRFRELSPVGVWGVAAHPLTPTIVFAMVGGFFAYRTLLRRVLQYLDPSEVIPERVRLVLDSLVEGVLVLDDKERIVLANRTFARMVGEDLTDLIGRPATAFDWKDHVTGAAPIPPPWVETIEDGAMRVGLRLELATGDGCRHLLSTTCAPIVGGDNVRRGVLITLADLTETELQKAELEVMVRRVEQSRLEIARQNAELQRLATIDPLTECLNRRALLERAEHYWALASRQRVWTACLMIDVDHFKRVNDEHGHKVGDDVLRGIAALLRAAARVQDVVGRYGGEEFCMLLPDTNAQGAQRVAERVRRAVQETAVDGNAITVSIGVAVSQAGAPSIEATLAHADQALYSAKRAGRNRFAMARSGQDRNRGHAA